MVLVMSLSVLGCGAKETAAPVTDTPDGDVNGSFHFYFQLFATPRTVA